MSFGVEINNIKKNMFGIQMVQGNANSNANMIYQVKARFGSMTHPNAQNVAQIGLLILWLVIVDNAHASIDHVLYFNGTYARLVQLRVWHAEFFYQTGSEIK